MGTILRWIAAALRDWLNSYINPNWKAEQEQLQKDAAAHQRAHAETEKQNAELEKHVDQRDKEIAQNEKLAEESEQRRVDESKRVDGTTTLKDLWFPEKK